MIKTPYKVLLEEGKVVFENFDTNTINFPDAATDLSLHFLLLQCDFEQGKFTLIEGIKTIISKNSNINHLELTTTIPQGNGILIGLVFGEFFQELNGAFYGLKECGMKVIGIA